MTRRDLTEGKTIQVLEFHQERPDDPFVSVYLASLDIFPDLAAEAMGTRIVGTLLAGLGELLPDEQLMLQRAGGEIGWNGGPWAAAPELEEHLSPASLTPSLRVLVGRLSDDIMKSIPEDGTKYGVSRGTRLQKKFPADEAILDETAAWFGVKKPQVHLVTLLPNLLAVAAGSPPLLVVGEAMYEQLTLREKRHVFGRGCKLAQSGFLPLLCVREDELPALWVATIQLFEPSFFLGGVAPDASGKFASTGAAAARSST